MLDPTRLTLGVGILLAMYLCVDNVHRARLMVMAFVAATFVFTLFGAAIVLTGDPILTIRLHIAGVTETTWKSFWLMTE